MKGKWRLKCTDCGHRWWEEVDNLDHDPISEECPECQAYPVTIAGAFTT